MKDWQLVVVSAVGGTIGAVATAAFMERRRNQFFADLERQSRQIEDLAVKQTQRPRPPAPSTARHALRDDDIRTTVTPVYAPVDPLHVTLDGGPERSWSPHRDADSSDVAGASERGLQNDYGSSTTSSTDWGSTGSDSSGSDGGGGGGSD